MLRKLEKYEILDEIGHGGMATVYRARDSRLDRPVAVKVMHPHLRGAQEARVRFTREAKSVARLKHAHILEIYDNSSEESDEAYIVTELLTGPTLKEFAEKHTNMPAEVAASFVIQIARALGCAHEAGIVHRDVKPENVLLHENRTIKLTDFGIAQMVDNQSMTATGQILGSPGHMAPEQIEGGHTDARSDIFSLGTVLYFLACGQLPFSGRNPHQILKRIVDAEHAHPLRVRPTVGARLAKIIEKTLTKSADDRYQTAADLERDLVAFVSEMGIDDPGDVLARYMTDAETVAKELHDKAIERGTALGRAAAQAGDLPTALDHYNRVLALDDGNEQVLALIDKIGRASRKKTQLAAVAAITVGVVAIGGIAWAAIGRDGGNPRDDIEPVAGELDGGSDAGNALAQGDVDAGPPDAGRRATTQIQGPRPPAHPPGPRMVVFQPTPLNVSIGVDGAEPRPYGSEFEGMTLPSGLHRFQVVSGTDDYATLDRTITIPTGSENEAYPLPLELRLKPGPLMVRGPVGATVIVGQDRATGSTNRIINVPLDDTPQHVSIRVTKQGFRDYTGTVRLTAGDPVELEVTLVEEASGSAP